MGNLNRKATRASLVHQFTQPIASLKVEFWPGKILVYGLQEDENDYLVFTNFDQFQSFWNLNYE